MALLLVATGLFTICPELRWRANGALARMAASETGSVQFSVAAAIRIAEKSAMLVTSACTAVRRRSLERCGGCSGFIATVGDVRTPLPVMRSGAIFVS